jgi:hypothetical protein
VAYALPKGIPEGPPEWRSLLAAPRHCRDPDAKGSG